MLVNAAGKTKATYRYNARGALVYSSGTDNIHEINPLRYRGYYYDTETGFYYLRSRYYDPAICRFINADSVTSTGQGFAGTNMLAYCLNNPVRRKDVPGTTCQEIFDDGNPTDDDKVIHGGTMSNGNSGSSISSGSSGVGSVDSDIGTV